MDAISDASHLSQLNHHPTVMPSIEPPFMVSAPGKVIVYGEHAVVYGKAAIAAAISLRSYLLVTFRPKSHHTISLCSPDIGLDYTWDIHDLPWEVSIDHIGKDQDCDIITAPDLNLVEALQPHIRCVSPHLPDRMRNVHQSSAFIFLYLFLSLNSPSSDSCIYTVRSTIPVGAGLGSSASLSVCIATALLLQTGALERPHPKQSPRVTESQIKIVNKWAFVAEMCIHGNPSGVDNTVSSGGRAVLYQRKDAMKGPVVIPLHCFPELPLLLVNTREPRNASAEIAKVRNLREKYPFIVDRVLTAIDATTKSAYELISGRNFEPKKESTQHHLGDLVNINHGLLALLGVSHPRLERVRELVDQLDIGWTKLTGAGGGGCAIVVPKPGVEIYPRKECNIYASCEGFETSKGPKPSSQKIICLDQMLAEEGMELFTTKLAGDGVGVLSLDDLPDELGEECDERTYYEMFLEAEGREAIESLVGMNMSSYGGWRFWRR